MTMSGSAAMIGRVSAMRIVVLVDGAIRTAGAWMTSAPRRAKASMRSSERRSEVTAIRKPVEQGGCPGSHGVRVGAAQLLDQAAGRVRPGRAHATTSRTRAPVPCTGLRSSAPDLRLADDLADDDDGGRAAPACAASPAGPTVPTMLRWSGAEAALHDGCRVSAARPPRSSAAAIGTRLCTP